MSKDETHVSFGKTVRNLREQLGMSQAGLAARMTEIGGSEIRPNTITKLEQALRPTTISEFGVIAQALGVAPSKLLEMTFPEMPESANEEELKSKIAEVDKEKLSLMHQLRHYESLVTEIRYKIGALDMTSRQLGDRLNALMNSSDNGND